MEKQMVIESLNRWIKQRPGLDFGNYGDVSAYRSELRGITKDLHDARAMLAFASLYGISGDDIVAASSRAYSGRLTINPDGSIDYCTGQYWPTEYRAAVCAVLRSAIWTYFRDGCGYETGDAIRKAARREFGRGLAGRWFN